VFGWLTAEIVSPPSKRGRSAHSAA
jgi:hypothetical protein